MRDAMNEPQDDHDKAWISALADGQLRGEALQQGLETLARDPAVREDWLVYHLIGDVLRAPELAGGTPSGVFLARLSQRLSQEPAPSLTSALPMAVVPEASRPLPTPAAPEVSPVATISARGPGANDGLFRWRRLAAVASMAVVATGGWLAFDAWRDPAQPQLARDESGRLVRDARLDDLIFAHRQIGGTNGLRAPSGLLHRVAFERPAPGR